VTLSLKGANSPTRGRKLRSTGTKAAARVSNGPNSLIELKKQLEARTRELAEALEQQTATSEVLKIISRSPGDLKPVFENILAEATRLCEAKFGVLWLCEDDGLRAVALHGAPPAYAEARQREPVRHGAKKAAIAVAASILTTVYHMLRDGTYYQDLGPEYFTRRNPAQAAARLANRIRNLGYHVEIRAAA
jgi:hypothetical protein